MSEKKKTRDIMMDILDESGAQRRSEDDAPGLKELIYRSFEAIEAMGVTKDEQDEELTAHEEPVIDIEDFVFELDAPAPERPEYISEEVDEELETVRERLHELLAKANIDNISKSQIIDQALRIVLAEFNQRGVHSVLVHKLYHALKEEK